MWKLILVLMVTACAPVDQESVRTVAAMEIPLAGDADRAELIAMLERDARAKGLHIDASTAKRVSFDDRTNTWVEDEATPFELAVWRGTHDDEVEAYVSDAFKSGHAWVVFLRGTQPHRSALFREPLIGEMKSHWPAAQMLPILPTGGIPNARDLVLTDQGYRIIRSAAPNYELPQTSILLTD